MSKELVERLLDLEDIRQLKARYCRFIDTKQWERLAGLFVKGTRFEGFSSAPTGADETVFVAGITKRLGPVLSIHHVHNPEITFTGPDTARGIWAMFDYLEFPEGAALREAPGARGFYGYGHYEEEYRRDNGEWKFSFLRLTRLRIDTLPAGHPSPLPGFLAASKDWL